MFKIDYDYVTDVPPSGLKSTGFGLYLLKERTVLSYGGKYYVWECDYFDTVLSLSNRMPRHDYRSDR